MTDSIRRNIERDIVRTLTKGISADFIKDILQPSIMSEIVTEVDSLADTESGYYSETDVKLAIGIVLKEHLNRKDSSESTPFVHDKKAVEESKAVEDDYEPEVLTPPYTSRKSNASSIKINEKKEKVQTKKAPICNTDVSSKKSREKLCIYTDGACSRNPGPGGWCAILTKEGSPYQVLRGGSKNTTNNRMELMAAVSAINYTPAGSEILLYSDSKYVVDGMRLGWAAKWKSNGWKNSNNQPTPNVDLWSLLLDLCKTRKATFAWVKGHSGNKYNSQCDTIAKEEALKASK